MRSRWIALLLSPIGLLLLSAFRLLVVSKYNTTTAVTVAESGGYVNTFLGSVIPLLPVFIPYIALILLLAEQYILTIIAFAFTVFISPTPLKLPVTARIAELDEHALLQAGARDQALMITLFVLALLAAAWYHRSFSEGVSTVAVLTVALALAAAPFVITARLPGVLRSAFAGEHQLFAWIPRDASQIATVVVGVVAVVILVSNLAPSAVEAFGQRGDAVVAMSRITAFVVAAVAAIALFPYLYNIYPLPIRTSYYVTVLRQPWLEAEEVTLTSGRVYVGYVLSTGNSWFTVLLAQNRTIIYIRASDVVGRAVCQVQRSDHLKRRPPLIPIFYSQPPRIRRCHIS